MGKRSKLVKHKCIHLQDMRLELEEATKGKYTDVEMHKAACEKNIEAYIKLYGGSKKSVLS